MNDFAIEVVGCDEMVREAVLRSIKNSNFQENFADFAGETLSIDLSGFKMPLRMGGVLDHIAARLREDVPRCFDVGPFKMDTHNHSLRDKKSNEIIRLTEKESALLALLARENGSVNRKTVLREVWGYADDVETHTLETHIYRLRQKIERNPARPEILLTDGEGYKLG